ncbi:hypothetical protein [Galbibacter pacificus]|uniref:DUF4625 domain-containing protein n=1 Tax=Galbibacter pacificus TaxID=2996052 RepID=A0ABT6FWL5_9FLAO|nr:hypothetical protein [Galbibacter pacificus]MDG3584164.1 hypothetical protein [Galbibacter pacificus]MDG3587655.1 hypothetical protein [Galbibacter pacificus]
MRNKLLFLLMFTLLLSCSKDDETPDVKEVDKTIWDITVTNVSATTVDYEEGNFNGLSSIAIAYRKKNDTKINQVYDDENREVGLEPYTDYEFFAYDTETGEVSDKKVAFTTLPFDVVFEEQNSNFSEYNVASHEGFEHAIKLKNISPKVNAINAKLIPEEVTTEPVLLENVRIENDSLYFTIPENMIPDDPYEIYRTYNIEYTVGNEQSFNLKNSDDSRAHNIVMVVYNKKPQILESVITKLEAVDYACGNVPSYNIALSGAFMNVDNTGDEGQGFIESNKVRVFVTDKDTDDFFFVEHLTDLQKCSFFSRLGDRPYENPFGLNVYHRMDHLVIRGLESEYEFHPGEFSIRVVFEQGDEFYETNEYSITITE